MLALIHRYYLHGTTLITHLKSQAVWHRARSGAIALNREISMYVHAHMRMHYTRMYSHQSICVRQYTPQNKRIRLRRGRCMVYYSLHTDTENQWCILQLVMQAS